MPITATCPRCHATGPVGAYLADAQVRIAWEALASRWARWPGLVARVLPYLDLHAPAEHRVHPPKLARLLGDLAALIDAGQAMHDGRPVPLHPGHWALAMDAAMDARAAGTLRLPLPDTFGWLTTVAATIAGDPARQAAAEALRRASPTGPAPAAGPRPTPPEVAAADDLRELVADLQHWERLAATDPGAAAPVMERLTDRYRTITGRPWRGHTQETAT